MGEAGVGNTENTWGVWLYVVEVEADDAGKSDRIPDYVPDRSREYVPDRLPHRLPT